MSPASDPSTPSPSPGAAAAQPPGDAPTPGGLATLVRFRAHPGAGDDLVAALRRMLPAAQREEGTVVYALHRDVDDPDAVLMYELYRDEAALEVHGASEEAGRLGPELGGLLAGEPVVWTGQLLAIVTPDGAAAG